MKYGLQFRDVFAAWESLLDGVWITLLLSAAAMLGGLIIGIACAAARVYGPGLGCSASLASMSRSSATRRCWSSSSSSSSGCPASASGSTRSTAAIIALSINLGAYATEIVRAGLRGRSRSRRSRPGIALGLSGLQVFRHVVLFPALKTMFPALASQFVLLMLATSIVSQISVRGPVPRAPRSSQSRTFRDFEVYAVIGVLYLALALRLPRHLRRHLSTWAFAQADDPRLRLDRCPLSGRGAALDAGADRRRPSLGGALLGRRRRHCCASARCAPLRWLAAAYIQLVQGTPLLVRLFMFFFGLPLVGLSCRSVARRRGWRFSLYGERLPRRDLARLRCRPIRSTQWEAGGCARALGFGSSCATSSCRRRCASPSPPTVGFLVQLIKNTSLASTIGFVELTREGQLTNAAPSSPSPSTSPSPRIYFALCFPLTQWSRRSKRRLDVAR